MKKAKKKLLKRKVSIGIILFAAIFIIFLSNNTTTAKAEHTNSIDVDCFKDETGYELIIDDVNWDVWYANNDSFHFLFFNFTYLLDGKTITIYTGDFNYDLSPATVSTSFLMSHHENTSLEIAVAQIDVGNDFSISIDADIIDLHVEPKSAPSYSPPPPVVIEGEEEVKEVIVDPFDQLEEDYKKHPFLAMLHGFLWGIFLAFIGFGGKYYAVKLKERPIPFVVNCVNEEDWREILPKEPQKHLHEDEEFDITHEMVKLGRYLGEKGISKITEKIVLEFKSIRAHVLEVHCDEHFAQVNTSRKRRVNIYQTDMIDYQLMIFRIPEVKQPFKQVLKKGASNRLRHYFAKHSPLRSLTLSLRSKVEFVDSKEKLRKVLYLIHRDGKERLKYIADFRYKQQVPDKQDPDLYKWQRKTAQPLFFEEILRSDPTVKAKTIRRYHMREIFVEIDPQYRDIYRESEDNLRIQMIHIKNTLLNKIRKLNEYILDLEEKQVQMKSDFELEYGRKTIELRQSYLKPLEAYTQSFAPQYAKTGNFEESRKEALKDLKLTEEYQNLKKLQEKAQHIIQHLENPAFVEELIASNKAKDQIINNLIKGDGNAKKGIGSSLSEDMKKIEDEFFKG